VESSCAFTLTHNTTPSTDIDLKAKGDFELEIKFFIPMIPPTVTHQEHKVSTKNGRVVFYDPPELKAAKQKLEAHLGKYVPEIEYTGPVRLLVKWCFPIKGNHINGEWKSSKPDTDNLQKMLKDVMTKLHYWKDDALVVSEIIEKFWADVPGIYIYVEEVE